MVTQCEQYHVEEGLAYWRYPIPGSWGVFEGRPIAAASKRALG